MKFTFFDEKPLQGYMRSWERLTKIQAITRPYPLCPEIGTKMSKAVQKKEKEKWVLEKPKLDKARKLRGIKCIDLAYGEYKDTIKKSKKEIRSSCGSGYALQDEDKKACLEVT